MDRNTKIFETLRPKLFRLAYSMLGRVAPAEDAVQEAYIRWQKLEPADIHSPEAFLSTVVSRICLDEIKSARNRREKYIGPDLPEPLLISAGDNPEEEAELAESVSMAMLHVLDELSPVQRAVFILREVFDYEYPTIAEIIHKSEANCRKIAQRARDRIHESRPRFDHKPDEQERLVKTFADAIRAGELSKIESMLAEDAILYSDGGGKVTAARKPIFTAEKIARFMLGIQKQAPAEDSWSLEFRRINAEEGMIIWVNGEVYNAWSFHIEDGKIRRIYVVLNPDKIQHLKKAL